MVIAAAGGLALYRYFTGHDGIRISRAVLGGLPAEGLVSIAGRDVRWTARDRDSFAAAWSASGSEWLAIRVLFEDEKAEAADQGRLDVTVAERELVRGAAWTDEIRTQGLRAEVELVLGALAGEAERARSQRGAAARARPVGSRPELPERPGPERGDDERER